MTLQSVLAGRTVTMLNWMQTCRLIQKVTSCHFEYSCHFRNYRTRVFKEINWRISFCNWLPTRVTISDRLINTCQNMQEALNRWFIKNFAKDLPLTYRVPKSRLLSKQWTFAGIILFKKNWIKNLLQNSIILAQAMWTQSIGSGCALHAKLYIKPFIYKRKRLSSDVTCNIIWSEYKKFNA